MKFLKRLLVALLIVGLVLVIIFYAGPRVRFDPLVDQTIENKTFTLAQVDSLVEASKRIPNLKPDNQSRIYWVDSIPKKTNWSLVYIHGFSASPEEGDPTYVEFGRRYGMNVYVPIMPEHGVDEKEAFLNLTPNKLIDAAKQAIQVGNSIGDTLIVMSCSTGSTLALYLAPENEDKIYSLMLYSPNLELEDQTAKMLTGPWGKQIVYQILGPYKTWKKPGDPWDPKDQYWTTSYRVEGLIALQSLLDNTMNDKILSQVSQPYFLAYYYKNEEERDKTVSISAIRHFNEIASTADEEKMIVAFPNVGAHVMTSTMQSKDINSVLEMSYQYAETILGLTPVN